MGDLECLHKVAWDGFASLYSEARTMTFRPRMGTCMYNVSVSDVDLAGYQCSWCNSGISANALLCYLVFFYDISFGPNVGRLPSSIPQSMAISRECIKTPLPQSSSVNFLQPAPAASTKLSRNLIPLRAPLDFPTARLLPSPSPVSPKLPTSGARPSLASVRLRHSSPTA